MSTTGLDVERVFSGVRWLAVGQIVSQVLRFVVSVALARLLAPEDFGLVTMAGVFTALAGLFSTLGAGPAIVQRAEVSPALLRSLATLGFAVGAGLSAALAVAAVPIAGFYGDPRVASILACLGMTFVLASLGIVPEALLQRELKFNRLVAIDLTVLVVSAMVSVGLAAAGLRVWALVAGTLTAAALRSALLLLSSPWRPSPGFDRQALRGVVGFSASIMAFNGTQYLSRNTDRLIIGRALGPVELGIYDYGYRFYMYPLESVTAVLISVMFPTFSRIQHDLGQLGRAFLRANGAIALLTFPMVTGLAVVADPFVRVVFGEKWLRVIPLIEILAPVGLLQSIGATPGQLFLARGKAALRFWWSVVYTTLIVGAFFAGIPWGILGMASAYALVMIPINIVAFWLALGLVDLGLLDLWRALARTTAATVGMGVVVLGVRLALEAAGVHGAPLLLTCIVAGIVAYVALVRWLKPEALTDLLRLLPSRLQRFFTNWLL
jgi:O-antigen/teichoic acid export membrane protein